MSKEHAFLPRPDSVSDNLERDICYECEQPRMHHAGTAPLTDLRPLARLIHLEARITRAENAELAALAMNHTNNRDHYAYVGALLSVKLTALLREMGVKEES